MKSAFLTLFLTIGVNTGFSQTCNLESENFDHSGSDPIGWTKSGTYIGTVAANSGSYHAGFNSENDAIVTDTYGCPSEMCFYWRTSGLSSDYKIDIQWSDDSGSNWNTIKTMNVQDTSSRTTYRQNCIDLSGISFSNSSNVSFQFVQYNRSVGSWYLDDVCISSGAATQLVFNTTPTSCILENTDLIIEVCAQDECGNLDTSFNGNITVSKNAGSGILSGTLSAAAVNGCALFSDLQFDSSDSYSLSASNASLSGSTSSVLEVKEACPLEKELRVMTYNLLNFSGGRDDCGTNTTPLNRVDTLKKIVKYINPDILMVCELQDEFSADLILNDALNTNGVTSYKRADFVPNQSTSFTGLNNTFFYNSSKVTLYSQSEITTGTRDVGEYVVFMNDPNLANHNDTMFIDFYEAHLKAGSGSTDIIDRSDECDSIRKYIDSKPEGRYNIIGGDFNFYTDSEAGYQTLCYEGTDPFNDPIASEGDWNSNASFSSVHTQSTRMSENIECGATGGVDDRFDFLLTSSNLLSGTERVKYILDSYDNTGNNGSTYNVSINDPSNTSSVPKEILTSLYYMSDHLPVTMDLLITYPLIDPVDPTVAIIEYEKTQNIEIYPNPTSSKFVINFSKEFSSNIISIYNLQGQVVYSNELELSSVVIDVSDWEKGIYFIKVSNDHSMDSYVKMIVN